MAGKFWRTYHHFGFGGLPFRLRRRAPASRPPPGMAPPPQAYRGPQEVALEQALGEFYGAPYRAGGSTPEGVDCSGLIQALFQRAGVILPRTVAQQYNAGRQVAPGELRFGDVVFFNRYCQTRGRDFYMAHILPPLLPKRFATMAFTWERAVLSTPRPGGCWSAAWTPKPGASLIKEPGAICLNDVDGGLGDGQQNL